MSNINFFSSIRNKLKNSINIVYFVSTTPLLRTFWLPLLKFFVLSKYSLLMRQNKRNTISLPNRRDVLNRFFIYLPRHHPYFYLLFIYNLNSQLRFKNQDLSFQQKHWFTFPRYSQFAYLAFTGTSVADENFHSREWRTFVLLYLTNGWSRWYNQVGRV